MNKTAEFVKCVEVTFDSFAVSLVAMSNQMVNSVKILKNFTRAYSRAEGIYLHFDKTQMALFQKYTI